MADAFVLEAMLMVTPVAAPETLFAYQISDVTPDNVEEDLIPSTHLLWGQELMISNQDVEATTSRKHDSDESDHEDPNRGRIRENISHLLA